MPPESLDTREDLPKERRSQVAQGQWPVCADWVSDQAAVASSRERACVETRGREGNDAEAFSPDRGRRSFRDARGPGREGTRRRRRADLESPPAADPRWNQPGGDQRGPAR